MTPPPGIRTVSVRSPSLGREAGWVAIALFQIVFWTALFASRGIPDAPVAGPTVQVAFGELALSALPPDEQTLYHAAIAALADAEAQRQRTGRWPELVGWQLVHDARWFNYVRIPPDPSHATFVIAAIEPAPGETDPGAVADETHHQLANGPLIHVGIYRGTQRELAKPLAQFAPQDGWQRIVAPVTPKLVAGAGPLRIGVTLHPYFSWTSNVVAGVPDMTVVAILPGDVDAGNYQPSPADIAKLANLDAIVVNGIGHDDFIRDMIRASGNTKLVVIEANAETPLIDYTHGDGKNSHTFISFTNAIQQSQSIARKLGELRPAHTERFVTNAAIYGDKLRAIADGAARRLTSAKGKPVVTVHDGYSYLLRDFGITLAGVIQPAHGLVPSAKELADMIALIRAQHVSVVFSEADFPDKLLATLRRETAANVFIISHVATGEYTADKFEREMSQNAETLVKALTQ